MSSKHNPFSLMVGHFLRERQKPPYIWRHLSIFHDTNPWQEKSLWAFASETLRNSFRGKKKTLKKVVPGGKGMSKERENTSQNLKPFRLKTQMCLCLGALGISRHPKPEGIWRMSRISSHSNFLYNFFQLNQILSFSVFARQ